MADTKLIGPIVGEPRIKCRVVSKGNYIETSLTKRVVWSPDDVSYIPADGELLISIGEVLDCFFMSGQAGELELVMVADQFSECITMLSPENFHKFRDKENTEYTFWFDEV